MDRPGEVGSGFGHQDTGYHGADVTPALGTGRPHHQASVEDAYEDGWDVWGGVGTRGTGAGAGAGGGARVRPEFDGGNRF